MPLNWQVPGATMFCSAPTNELDLEITPPMRENLERAHYEKIDQSDGIYVVDIGRYIGRSVRREIAYARPRGKEILIAQ